MRIFLTAVFALLAANALFSQASDERYRNGIAAIVNDRIITYEDVRREIAPLQAQLIRESKSQQDLEDRFNRIQQEILRNLIDRILIIKAFYDKGYAIPKSYLESAFEDRLRTQFNGDRQLLLETLRLQGKSVADFRKDIEERIIEEHMRGQLRRTLAEVSPERVSEFYETHKADFRQKEGVRLRQITIYPKDGESADDAKARLAAAENALASGKPFADVAREYSQDEKREQGGDWGWQTREDLRKELADAVFACEPGQYTRPIALGNYTFILCAEEKRAEGIQPIDEVRGRIEATIAAEIARNAQQKWLERLRKDAYIKIKMY